MYKHAPSPFSAHDRAVLRICALKNWTLDQWYAQPESEQIEWLANDAYLQKSYRLLQKQLIKTTDKGKVCVDFGAYMYLQTLRL